MRQIAMLAVLLGSACSPTATGGYADVTVDITQAIQATALGPGDVFEVRVYQEPDLSGIFRVSPDGEVVFPLVGRVKVEGLTANEVAQYLADRLRDGYLRTPYVTVFVKEFNSKKVSVLGQVAKPGTFSFEDGMNIVQAIALAGGFSPTAQKNYTIVTRLVDGKEVRIPVPVEKISEGLSKNFYLRPGDIIFIPETVL